ncbi:PREDICTED: acidic amino acid decarboxylase GADL1-like, partial [Pterocles gutturalis]|uniref:acidic amino acid decarboxylase GADL1-like n=1 Tax=Pterocles gutturalis TaxID=240206 RepID=UPI00052952C7
SHYSMKKAASFLGIGTENVYFIKTDERGKMIPEELEKQVQRARKEGSAPFLVCATAGTTVLGAFDPLDKIADICEKHDLWLHVDASWGGSALISRKHRRLLHGIHRADSVAWNPHKMLLAGIQCCALLVKDNSGLLKKCYSAKAAYLFQQDKFYDVSYDTGDKSIQCSRRPDAFKFWLMWKALGTTGLEERVNRALALARYLLTMNVFSVLGIQECCDVMLPVWHCRYNCAGGVSVGAGFRHVDRTKGGYFDNILLPQVVHKRIIYVMTINAAA